MTDILNGLDPLDPISDIVTAVAGVMDRIFPDKTAITEDALSLKKAQLLATLKVVLAQDSLLQGQLNVDTEEAKSASIWVAGWRPFIGWVCGVIFAWTYLIQPMIIFFYTMVLGHQPPVLPTFSTADIMNVTFGMLGLGGMRSWEKQQNVAHKH
jgi:hypothetical protein